MKQQNHIPHSTVTVDLGDRTYDIKIGEGLLEALGDHLLPILPRPRVVIITDENVGPIYLPTVTRVLKASGVTVDSITLPAGEASKSITHYESLMDQLILLGTERKDTLIALGGGVIGDLTGFAAATLRRGINFIQIPTSLLAQVDSSVGGKTGINSKHGKNLIGAFYQPLAVIIDLSVLDTLPKRELQAGYAEVVKYGAIDNKEFFVWLETNGIRVINGNRQAQKYVIETSCRAKARIVSEDELEHGKRALLNFGHTFGHALEAEFGYDGRLLHGEGVAIGMVMALSISAKLGMTKDTDAKRLRQHLKDVGMMTNAHSLSSRHNLNLSAEKLFSHMAQDKKVSDGKMVFILGPLGAVCTRNDVNPKIIIETLEQSIHADD